MTPIKRIRVEVFRLKQTEFAEAIGVTQPTVSRWESGALHPSMNDLAKIRDLAKARSVLWNDSWFFEAPKAA